jgi:hypothetical protein
MRKTIISTTIASAVLLAAAPAFAGGSSGSFGAGVDVPLASGDGNGLAEASLDYDGGKFNAGGGLGIADPDGPHNTQVDVSGHFYFHVASSAMADFGIGGDILFQSLQNGPAPGTTTDVFLDPGIQVRAFIASNVALVFTAGLSIGVGDSSAIFFGGNPVADAGFRYYFF